MPRTQNVEASILVWVTTTCEEDHKQEKEYEKPRYNMTVFGLILFKELEKKTKL